MKYLLFFFVLLLSLFITCHTLNQPKAIEIYDENTNEMIVSFPIEPGERFYIEYTHSMYETKQWEMYVVEEDGFLLEHVEFESFDAANYYGNKRDTAKFQDDFQFGNWQITRNQSLDTIRFRVPYLYPLVIGYHDERLTIQHYTHSGTPIVIQF
ncbi:DUF1850 domain-containing protein [Geomicrobium sediminis]|uniref:DUF1850 domain-containing protein n=1 Tax=Geomicrobium sediminis TaxID=1347788 RepID=A0ABS2PBS5_9BACL|nr:DUF1850 domain-containing protein [Geomicrobium sediminis]MBM7632869.1 hypothetical protein [Geomicrobium sediminis]